MNYQDKKDAFEMCDSRPHESQAAIEESKKEESSDSDSVHTVSD